MSTFYNIPDFLRRVEKYTGETDLLDLPAGIADFLQLLPVVLKMIPWVHYTKEWEVMAEQNTLSMSGVLAPRLITTIVLSSNLELRVVLAEFDEMDTEGHAKDTFFDRTVSTDSNDVIGCLSLMLNKYQHRVSIGQRRYFWEYRTLEPQVGCGCPNVINMNHYEFRDHIIILSPTEETFYDCEDKEWIHPTNNTIQEMLELGFLKKTEVFYTIPMEEDE